MDSFSYKVAKLQGYVYDHLELDENGAARVIITQDLLKAHQLTDAGTAEILSQLLVELRTSSCGESLLNKKAVISVYDCAANSFQSMKSQKIIMAEDIPLASGANSYSLEENEEIFQELKELAKSKENERKGLSKQMKFDKLSSN